MSHSTVFCMGFVSIIVCSIFFGTSAFALDGAVCRKTATGRYAFDFQSNNGHVVSVYENTEAKCMERGKAVYVGMNKICTCYEKMSSILMSPLAILAPLVYLTSGPYEFGVYCYSFDGAGNLINGNGTPQLKIDGCVEKAERAEKSGFTQVP